MRNVANDLPDYTEPHPWKRFERCGQVSLCCTGQHAQHGQARGNVSFVLLREVMMESRGRLLWLDAGGLLLHKSDPPTGGDSSLTSSFPSFLSSCLFVLVYPFIGASWTAYFPAHFRLQLAPGSAGKPAFVRSLLALISGNLGMISNLHFVSIQLILGLSVQRLWLTCRVSLSAVLFALFVYLLFLLFVFVVFLSFLFCACL